MPSPVITELPVAGSSTLTYSTPMRPPQAGRPGIPRPTFVLVAGIGMSHRYYRRLGQALAAVGDVHAVDLAGFGATRRPREAMTVAAQATALAAALDAVGASSCVVVGHSMGAQFVTELGVIRPDLVSHLVLIGPVTDSAHPSVRWQAARLSLDTVLETPAINMIVLTDYMRCGVRWYVSQLRAMLRYPLLDRIAQVGSPVLVLRGERDPIASRRWCASIAARAADGSSRSVAGGAHVIHHSRAAEVASVLVRFAGIGADAAVPRT
jgi:pimeloyl-ACP methyl ester carboxylesterase